MRWFYGKSVSITSIPTGIKAKRRSSHLKRLENFWESKVMSIPAFSIFNRAVIKPALKEINDLTSYHVEVEQKTDRT